MDDSLSTVASTPNTALSEEDNYNSDATISVGDDGHVVSKFACYFALYMYIIPSLI